MVEWFEQLGTEVSVKTMPDACTMCPFWNGDMDGEKGMCYITGTTIDIDGQQDEKRMDDCVLKRRSAVISYPWIEPQESLPADEYEDIIAIDTEGDIYVGYYNDEDKMWRLEGNDIPTDDIALWAYYPEF